jgi:hypothetical protein
MSKFTKDVIDTSYTVRDVVKGFFEHVHVALQAAFQRVFHKTEDSLDKLNEKRIDLRDDLFW